MKNLFKNNREFLAKSSELLKEEKFDELVKSFEEQSKEITDLEKTYDEEQAEIKKSEEKKAEEEKIETESKEEEIQKMKAEIKKFAELYASAPTVEELVTDLWKVKALLAKSTAEIEAIKKTTVISKQPEEWIKKSSDDDLWKLW